jgi:hypothetical protein
MLITSGANIPEFWGHRKLYRCFQHFFHPTHTVGELQFAYLGSAQLSRLASIDYTANTYTVNSQCTPVTTECKMGYIEDGVGARYDCPFEFVGTAYTYTGAANSLPCPIS